jgi:hypothetical protein
MVLLYGVAGCGENGPPPGPPLADPQHVHGKIKFKDGTPLKGGVVYFTPTEYQSGKKVRYEVSGLVDTQGHYKLGLNGTDTGAAPGEYKVSFKPRETQELRGSNASRIPKSYHEQWETPVRATVKEGENTLDFIIN